MAKRLTEIEKEEILKKFTQGETLEQLSQEFKCTKLTISRNLKKNLGEEVYKSLVNKNSQEKEPLFKKNEIVSSNHIDLPNKYHSESDNLFHDSEISQPFQPSTFVEIAPLNHEIDNAPQKDLSSIPLSEINFPKLVYIIIDNKIELETKKLKDYPDWQFLPMIDLERKTIEIFFDLKVAKRSCNKDHKVIKVPNTNIFKVVAPILRSRGITRIISEDKLIAL